MPKPYSGEWLDDDLKHLSKAGITVIVSLLEIQEACELGLSEEKKYCEINNIKYISFPIPDRCLPDSLTKFSRLSKKIYNLIAEGNGIAVHCRAGIGRSGILTASVLLHAGYGPEEAFNLISKARGTSVPDTEEQYNWIKNNYRRIIKSQ